MTDSELIEKAIAEECKLFGMIDDPDVMLSHPAFKDARAKVKVENGEAVGVTDAVAEMRRIKPDWFRKDWSTASPEQFAAMEERLTLATPRTAPDLPRLDFADLNAEESDSLERVLRGHRDPVDLSVIDRAQRRQTAAAA